MILKSPMWQFYHFLFVSPSLRRDMRTIKLSLLLTIWGGYYLAIAPQNPAEANTIHSEINTEIYLPKNQFFTSSQNTRTVPRTLGHSHTQNTAKLPILQAQLLPQPLPAQAPPSFLKPSSTIPPPPETGGVDPYGVNTLNPTGFPNLTYAVYINGNSPLLLQIIREIQSRAVLRKYQNLNVIQIGSFTERLFAEDLVTFFAFQGIKAEITKLDVGEIFGEDAPTETADLFPPVNQPIDYGLGEKNAYYVLIPEEPSQLLQIIERMRLLGIPQQQLQITETPSNVAIGPFTLKENAEQWENYLRKNGFSNAEIYFGR